MARARREDDAAAWTVDHDGVDAFGGKKEVRHLCQCIPLGNCSSQTSSTPPSSDIEPASQRPPRPRENAEGPRFVAADNGPPKRSATTGREDLGTHLESQSVGANTKASAISQHGIHFSMGRSSGWQRARTWLKIRDGRWPHQRREIAGERDDQDDVGHVILGQHVVRLADEINGNEEHGLRQDVGVPNPASGGRFNAKQLDHGPVLVVFDDTMVDAPKEAAPFNQALDSKRKRGIGIGIVVAEDRHVGPSRKRNARRQGCLRSCARTQSLAAESSESSGRSGSAATASPSDSGPTIGTLGQREARADNTWSSLRGEASSTTSDGVTRRRGQGVDRHGLRKGDHLAPVEVVLASRLRGSPHRSDGSACTTLQGERGVARANEEVHRSLSR